MSYWRNTSYNAVRLVFSTSMAIMYGIIFWKLGSKRRTKQDILNGLGAMYFAMQFMGTQSAATVRPVVITERIVYNRERGAGMYSALPFALAQVAIEIPYILAQVLIYGIIAYAMIGYEWTATKFFLNTMFMLITTIYFVYYGIMVIAVSPNQETAVILSSVFYTTWNLFSGFVIPRTRVAVWWRWYTWFCPLSWSLYGMAASQYGDVLTKLDSGETVAEFLRDYFGFRHDMLWVAALALVGFSLVFVSAFAYSIKFLNFQKR